MLGLDPLDLGEGDVEIGAVLLVPPRDLPQLLLPFFEEVLMEESATTEIMILEPLSTTSNDRFSQPLSQKETKTSVNTY